MMFAGSCFKVIEVQSTLSYQTIVKGRREFMHLVGWADVWRKGTMNVVRNKKSRMISPGFSGFLIKLKKTLHARLKYLYGSVAFSAYDEYTLTIWTICRRDEQHSLRRIPSMKDLQIYR
jgi:hypothetical protein